MEKNDTLNRIIIGIKKNFIKLLLSAFIVYATLWTILEPILGMLKSAEPYLIGWQKYLFLVSISRHYRK